MSAEPGTTTNSVFHWKTYTILQGDDVLKIGTDAILLGTWIGKLGFQANHIIDAGCGTGILSIMAAFHFPSATITAIDVNEKAIALTNANILKNGLDSRVYPDLRDLLRDRVDVKRADIVVSNPPYFLHQLPSPEKTKAVAKHAVQSPGAWMSALSTLVRPDGGIAIIIPYEGASHWISGANDTGWYCVQRVNVYSFATDEKPVRSLLLFTTNLQRPGIASLILYDQVNRLSDNYSAWLK